MKIVLQYWKLNFLSLIEYKLNFLIEVVGMILNDVLFVSIWYMFFMKFWTIWSMQFWDYASLMSIMVFVFAYIHIFFWNYINIWTMIEEWKLDSHLLLPKNILIRLLSWRMMTSAFWDVIFWFMLMFFIPNLTIIIVFKILLFSFIWSITFLWFLLIFVSLSFFIWSSKNLIRWVFEAILWPSHYPPNIFEWTLIKYIFMTIIPIYFVVFQPYELITNFSLSWFLYLLLWAIFFMSFWIFLFYKWLKRYESGSMMNMNI